MLAEQDEKTAFKCGMIINIKDVNTDTSKTT